MILTLQNVIYYLYSNNFIEEKRIFENTIEARQEESLNNTFLVRFKDKKGTIQNDGRVVKQAFKLSDEQRISLRKDAYFTCIFEKDLILTSSQNCLDTLKSSIDDEKLIFIRRYLSGMNFYSFLKSLFQESPNIRIQKKIDINITTNVIFEKINAVHNFKLIDKEIISLNLSFPISIIVPKVNSSLLQQFWRIVGNPFKQFIKDESEKWGKVDGYKQLIHGDFSLRNILYSDENKFYFVDWEFAQYGNPVWDYAWLISDIEITFAKEEFKELIESLKKNIYDSINDKVFLEKYILTAKLRRALRNINEGVFSEETAKTVSRLNSAFEKL